MSRLTAMPRKTREMMNHHMDSTVWNDFAFRDDDVIVSTYAKSGTTWTQQIVGQLIFGGREDVAVAELSPWVDMRILLPEVRAGLETQTHRRILKTHLPVDALVMSPRAKYIYVARDGRDVLWSLYNHHASANALFFELINGTPGRVGPALEPADPDIRRYFRTWLEADGAPFWSFWDNVRSWWAVRSLPNVHVLHFNALKADLEGEMRRIAAFLDITVAEADWPRLVRQCGFDWMKANAERVAPLGGAVFEGGAQTFINKGSNGRWQGVLSAAEIRGYERRALRELGPECAYWLTTGEAAEWALAA